MSSAGAKQVFGAVLTFAGAAASGGTSLLLTGAGLGLLSAGVQQGAKQAQAEARRRAQREAAARTIKSNIRGTTETHFVVFGYVRAGGIIVDAGTTLENIVAPQTTASGVLHIAIAHSITHPGGAEGYEDIWVDDVRIDSSEIDGQGRVTNSRYVDGSTYLLTVTNYKGTATQGADPTLAQALPGRGTDYRRGIAWTLFTLRRPATDEQFQKAFPRGIPVLAVGLKGNKCYDPRLDSTQGGSGDHRQGSPTTWAYSRNPAVCAATYMIMDVSDGGMGYDPARIDWPSVAAAANICDEQLTSTDSPTVTFTRYQCNIALDTADSRESNLQKILDTMQGVRVKVGDKYKLYAGAYDSPAFSLDETYLRGPLKISTRSPLDELYNAVRIVHDWEDQNFQTVTAPPFTNASYEAQDGGERLWKEETLAGVTNSYQAQYISTVMGKRSRKQKTIEAPCNLKALDIEAWQTGYVTIGELGIDEAVYRVMEWRWDNDGPVLILREESSDIYTEANPTFVTPVTVSVDTETPPTPSGLTATAVYDGITLKWTAPADPSSYKYIEVYRATADSPSVYTQIGKAIGLEYHDPLTDGSTRDYRLRARGKFGGVSDYSGNAVATARTIPAVASTGTGVSTYSQFNTSQNQHEFFNLLAERGIEICSDPDNSAVCIEALSSEDGHMLLSADVASTSTSLADVSNFKFQLAENSLYCIKLRGIVQTAATTTGFKIGATAPTGSSMNLTVQAPDSNISTTGFHGFASGTTSVSVTTANMPAANTNYPFLATFIVRTGAESGSPSTGFVGDFQIQWATEVGSSAATLKADSLMVIDLLTTATPTATVTLQNPGLDAAYTSSDTLVGTGSVSASLTLTCKTDGTWTIVRGSGDGGTGSTLSGNWGTPTTAGVGPSYEVIFVVSNSSGGGTVSNDAASWTPLDVNRMFKLQCSSTGGDVTHNLDVQMVVRQRGTTTPTSDDTADWTVTASVEGLD